MGHSGLLESLRSFSVMPATILSPFATSAPALAGAVRDWVVHHGSAPQALTCPIPCRLAELAETCYPRTARLQGAASTSPWE